MIPQSLGIRTHSAQKKPKAPPQDSVQILNRRGFLKGLVAGVAAASVAKETILLKPQEAHAQEMPEDSSPQELPLQQETPEKSLEPPQSFERWLQAAFFTSIESVGVSMGGYRINRWMDARDIPHGAWATTHEEIKQSFLQNPITTALKITVGGPFLEELGRMILAQKFFGSPRGQIHWGYGAFQAFMFALFHNFRSKVSRVEETAPYSVTGYKVETTFFASYPVSHFALGLYAWFALRSRGFFSAFLGHSIYNGIAFYRHGQQMMEEIESDGDKKAQGLEESPRA